MAKIKMTAYPKGIPLSFEQKIAWLQLIRSENIGSASFWALLKKYHYAEAALAALPEIAFKHGKKNIKIACRQAIEKELLDAQRLNIRFICAGEPDYPPFLNHIYYPPPVITIRGNSQLFQKTGFAIVGSRNSSAIGQKTAYSFAQSLSEKGLAIISGFARGIDSAAHLGSLKHGTVAVLAGGINYIYPTENEKLYYDILDNGGLIVSEMPINFPPRAVDFPRRNRLIAALSLGILIIEAAQRSGSLITARLANEIGRHIFAIPGSPYDFRAAGTNDLIKNGAQLVTNAEEIIEILKPLTPAGSPYRAANIEDKIANNNAQLQLAIEERIAAQTAAPKENMAPFFSEIAPSHIMSQYLAPLTDEDNYYPSEQPSGSEEDEKQEQIKLQTSAQISSKEAAKDGVPPDMAPINKLKQQEQAKEPESTPAELSEDIYKRILSNLSPVPIDLASLGHYAKVPLSQLYLALVELDIAGRIIRHPDGLVSLRV